MHYRFDMTVDCVGAAFHDDEEDELLAEHPNDGTFRAAVEDTSRAIELARILRKAADQIWDSTSLRVRPILDLNGRPVGEWQLVQVMEDDDG